MGMGHRLEKKTVICHNDNSGLISADSTALEIKLSHVKNVKDVTDPLEMTQDI